MKSSRWNWNLEHFNKIEFCFDIVDRNTELNSSYISYIASRGDDRVKRYHNGGDEVVIETWNVLQRVGEISLKIVVNGFTGDPVYPAMDDSDEFLIDLTCGFSG